MRISWLDRLAVLAVVLTLAILIGGSAGTHASFAVSTGNPGNAFSTVSDWKPPIVNRATAIKAEGGIPGYLRAGGSYTVVADVADDPSSNPPSGLGTVTSNVTSLTTGASGLAMTATASTVGGLTYSHKSAAQTVTTGKAAGTYSSSITASDRATPVNTASAIPFTVVVDNTPPSALKVTTTNAGGSGGVGKVGTGDTITYTWNDLIDPASIVSGWDGTGSQNVTVQLMNKPKGQGGDQITIMNAANTAQLPLGLVQLGDTGYVSSGTATFGGPTNATRSTMTWNATSGAVTVTVGALDAGGGTPGTVTTPSSMTWTPQAAAFDRAGNSSSTTAWTETTTGVKF